MRKFIFLLFILFINNLIFSQYYPLTLINLGGGGYYSITSEKQPNFDIYLSCDVIKTIESNGLGIGSKYQLGVNQDLNINNRFFITFMIYELYDNMNKNPIPPLFLPNFEVGFKINNELSYDFIVGMYWIGLGITPSLNYSLLNKELEIGLMISVPINMPR